MDCAFEQIVKRLIDSLSTKDRQYIDPVEHCVEVSAEAIKADKYIFVCGNGGSASTASHIAKNSSTRNSLSLLSFARLSYRVIYGIFVSFDIFVKLIPVFLTYSESICVRPTDYTSFQLFFLFPNACAILSLQAPCPEPSMKERRYIWTLIKYLRNPL